MSGSVKREGNSWYYVFSLGKDSNGKRKQKKKRGFKTKKDAQKALTEAMNSFFQGTYIEPSKTLFQDYLTEWFQTKRRSIGIQTAQVYEHYLNSRIIPKLGKIAIAELSTLHIQSYINNLQEDGLSSSTVKKNYEIIRNSLEHAIDFGLIQNNVALKVKLPKSERKELMVWDEDEVNHFLQTAKEDRYYIVFYLAVTTGMRQGEILGLRWSDVNLKDGLLSIRQTLSHDGKTFINGAKTKASLRTIALSEATIKKLQNHKMISSQEKLAIGPGYLNHNLVISTQIGSPVNPANIRRSFNRLTEVACLPRIRFHDLRHTHASLLLSKGINIKVISERLGHSNIKITLDTYSHVLPTMQKEAMQKLDEMVF